MGFFFIGILACASPDPEVVGAESPVPVAEKEEKSLYDLDVPFVGQDGVSGWDRMRGYPTIFSMFYTSCPQACPLLIQDIQALESELSEGERANLRVVLVSMDPVHDVPEALVATVRRHRLDGRWVLGVVPEKDVRRVAAVLGVRYRPLEGGGFAHTSVLTLVDKDGTIRARSEASVGRGELLGVLRGLW